MGTIVDRRNIILLLLAGLYSLSLQAAAGAAPTQRQESATIKQSPDRSALFLDGFIDDEAVAVVEGALQEGTVKTLYVRSTGGAVAAGIRLGELIRDTKLTVVVVSLCASSCANYLFTAGKDRVINGVVLWHGSAEQKDFRELYLCGRSTSSLFGTKMGPIAPEQRTKQRETWEALRERQARFFASIGVNEYITRAGQEPVLLPGGFTSDFTYDVPTMERFGLTDVVAPEGYGTAAWCANLNKKLKEPIGCVTVTDEMLAYDRVRKERGEECLPDGTLRTRAQAQ
jgi:hypothetical protein